MPRQFVTIALAILCLLGPLFVEAQTPPAQTSPTQRPAPTTVSPTTGPPAEAEGAAGSGEASPEEAAEEETAAEALARLRDHLDAQRRVAQAALARPSFPAQPRDNALLASREDLAVTIAEIRQYERSADSLAERDRWIQLLVEARQLHARVAEEAPREETDRDWEAEVSRIGTEIQEARQVLGAWGRELVRRTVEEPRRWLDLSVDGLLQLIMGSFELLVLILVWLYARRWSRPRLMRWFKRMQARRQRMHESGRLTRFDHLGLAVDLRELAAPATQVVRALIDVLAAWAGYSWVLDPWPLLHFLALLWLLSSLFRFGLRLTRLLVTSSDAERPGLILVGSDRRRLLERTVRVLLLWTLGTTVVSRLLLSLGLIRLHEYSGRLITLGTIVLLLAFLGAWSPWLRGAVALQLEANPFTRWLIRTDGGPLLRLLRAAGAAVLLTLLTLARLVGEVFGDRAWSTWLRHLLARRQLRDTFAHRSALPDDVRKTLLGAETVRLPRLYERQIVEEAYVAWRRSQRRGLAVVLGDSGMGRTTFLDQAEIHLLRLLRSEGPEAPRLRRLRLEHHMHSPVEALRWMSSQLLDPMENPGDGPVEPIEMTALLEEPRTSARARADTIQRLQENLRTRLEALPPHIILLDDLHKLLLRSVGGFDALRRVLEVLQMTSEEHFWLTSFHHPTWNYLQGVPELVNLGVFSHVLTLQRFSGDQLREWMEALTRVAGTRLRFEPLVAPALMGADSQRALQRTTDAYWRLLADASMGNPRVALHYWLESLHDGSALPPPRLVPDLPAPTADSTASNPPATSEAEEASPPRDVAVGLFHAPGSDDTAQLKSDELFVLSALVLHDGLGAEQLSQVLNMPLARLQSVCRRLEGLGVLIGDDAGAHYDLATAWRPAVYRLLQSKHFLELREIGTAG